MDLVSRLKQYLDARQISVTQFADECSIPRPTASQLLAGRNKKVSDEIISKIHITYPDLSIVWLMFGEGDMKTDTNIKTSEPQISNIFDIPEEEPTDNQISAPVINTNKFNVQNSSEKFDTPNPSEFSFPEATKTPPNSPLQQESAFTSSFSFTNDTNGVETSNTISSSDSGITTPKTTATETSNDSRLITVTPGKGKRVTGIVVYYDDSTYESFVPDSTHRHPFMS